MEYVFSLRESSQGQNVSEFVIFCISSFLAMMIYKTSATSIQIKSIQIQIQKGSIQKGIIEDTIERAERGFDSGDSLIELKRFT